MSGMTQGGQSCLDCGMDKGTFKFPCNTIVYDHLDEWIHHSCVNVLFLLPAKAHI